MTYFGLGRIYRWYKIMRRRSKTNNIAMQVVQELVNADRVLVLEKHFIDEQHLKEVIEKATRLRGDAVRANVFNGVVVFYEDARKAFM